MSKIDNIKQDLNDLGQKILNQIQSAKSLQDIENIRVHTFGKKGILSESLKGLREFSADEKPLVGSVVNAWKQKLETAIETKVSDLECAIIEEKVAVEKLDISQNARQNHIGNLHLITQVTYKILDTFGKVGFDITTGPEVETEYLNFEAVNIPPTHPARDMQDSFFLSPGILLRTQTSPVQMRAMRAKKWPLRILAPGAVYRCDNDATHLPMFHQIEGLWVDIGIKMSDLKGTLAYFARELFGTKTRIRLRPSYFPFVEPGAEVDVSCFQCSGKLQQTCRICKGTGWVEILGAGMVHPRLFEMAGPDYLDPGLSGFAFGIGVDRVAMLLHQISDIRYLVNSDMRILRQFSF